MPNEPNPKKRFGDRKIPLALLPGPALAQVALVLKSGADKYGAFNWRYDPVESMVYAHAGLRHIHTWIDGENYDYESGYHLLAHVAANSIILLDAYAVGSVIETRPKFGNPEMIRKEIIHD